MVHPLKGPENPIRQATFLHGRQKSVGGPYRKIGILDRRFHQVVGSSEALGREAGTAIERGAVQSAADDLLSDGVENQFGGVVKVELLHDPTAVSVDSVDAEVQGRRDFLI